MNMNWNWPHRTKDVLTDKASSAETRLGAIKKAAKTFKKSVEDSLKTAPKNKNEDLETRKRRTGDYILGENVASALQGLHDERVAVNLPATTQSPLNVVLERFANLHKTLSHMQTVNEQYIFEFLNSDTPIAKLLAEDLPAVANAKKDLEQLCRRQAQSQSALEKEDKKLQRMYNEEDLDSEVLETQKDKRNRLQFELENLNKEVCLEQDKLTSNLLTLVSRENRYACSIMELIKIKKRFYDDAFRTIEVELPFIERILQETKMRPVFGERIEDHLRSSGRTIAYPIALTVKHLINSGLNDEGLFRISAKQIKLDKFKAHIDSHQSLEELLQDSDCHLHSALLKSYLRELPVPLLGEGSTYDKWIALAECQDPNQRIQTARNILKDDLPELVVKNIQFVIKFLRVLSENSQTTKMTPHNISIVMGPTLLWSNRGSQTEHNNIECVIAVVATLIEYYDDIFPDDIDLNLDKDDGSVEGVEMRAQPHTGNSDNSSPTLPEIPPRPVSIIGAISGVPMSQIQQENPHSQSMTNSTLGADLFPSASASSPNHRRKASIRSMGRQFMAKINSQGIAPSSSTTSQSPTYKQTSGLD